MIINGTVIEIINQYHHSLDVITGTDYFVKVQFDNGDFKGFWYNNERPFFIRERVTSKKILCFYCKPTSLLWSS